MNSLEFKKAVDTLSKEKGIDKDYIFDAMELALTSAYKKNYHSLSNVRVDINRETGEKVFLECKHKDHTVVFGDRREDGSCWIGTGLDRRQLLPMFDCIDNFEVNGMLYFLIRETRMEYWLYIDDFV